MVCTGYPDIHGWIQGLPPVSRWQDRDFCTEFIDGKSLQLRIARSETGIIHFSVRYKKRRHERYWNSKPIDPKMKSLHVSLLKNFIEEILGFWSEKKDITIKRPKLNPTSSKFKDIFNLCFFMLSFIFFAKMKIIPNCHVEKLHDQLRSPQLEDASKKLMKILGRNLEVEWVRSTNAAYAYLLNQWPTFFQDTVLPSPTSYSSSENRHWHVQLFCPIMAMKMDGLTDGKFLPSLNKNQIEGDFQLDYKVDVRKDSINVAVNVENVRISIRQLNGDEEFEEEKHFPSRVLLNLTPVNETDVKRITVTKTAASPTSQLALQKNFEIFFQLWQPVIGGKIGAGETMSTFLKSWTFEESADCNSGIFDWVLYDVKAGGKEVYLSEPSKKSLNNPNAWFKNRYSSANSPFTRKGGVVFARDTCGQPIEWKIHKNAIHDTTKWKLKGQIWLTYWPNKHQTSYYETRSIEFEEILDLTIPGGEIDEKPSAFFSHGSCAGFSSCLAALLIILLYVYSLLKTWF